MFAEVSCRAVGIDFDIAATAGWYSAIAGMLAGFALLAILLPLDHAAAAGGDEAESSSSNAEVVFTCAFFSLLVLGITYAVLAGRTSDGPQAAFAAAEQLWNGTAFGLSSLLLLFGLHAVLGAYGGNRLVFQPARRVIVAMTSIYGPLIVLALQFSSALDLEHYRADAAESVRCGWLSIPNGVWVNVAIVGVAALGVVSLALLRQRLPRIGSVSAFIAKVVLGGTIGVAVATSAVLPLLSESVVAGAAFEHVSLVIGSIATVAVAAASWISR